MRKFLCILFCLILVLGCISFSFANGPLRVPGYDGLPNAFTQVSNLGLLQRLASTSNAFTLLPLSADNNIKVVFRCYDYGAYFGQIFSVQGLSFRSFNPKLQIVNNGITTSTEYFLAGTYNFEINFTSDNVVFKFDDNSITVDKTFDLSNFSLNLFGQSNQFIDSVLIYCDDILTCDLVSCKVNESYTPSYYYNGQFYNSSYGKFGLYDKLNKQFYSNTFNMYGGSIPDNDTNYTLLFTLNLVLDFAVDTLSTIATSIISNPILLIPCVCGIAFLGVLLFRRLLGV